MKYSALDYYIGKDGLRRRNCAQAILSAHQEALKLSDETINEFRQYGSGQAPENTCGAIYAAEYLLKLTDHEDRTEDLQVLFFTEAGSTKCQTIRQNKQLSCLGCVQNADCFVSEVIFGESDLSESEKVI